MRISTDSVHPATSGDYECTHAFHSCGCCERDASDARLVGNTYCIREPCICTLEYSIAQRSASVPGLATHADGLAHTFSTPF